MEDRALLAETADGREAPPLRPPTRTMAFAVVALCLVAVGVVATRDPALGAVAAGGLALVDVADDAAVSGSAMTATPAALGSVSKGHPSVEEVYISVNASAAVSSIMPLSVRVTVTDPTAAPAKVDAMKISLAYKPVSGSSLDALFTEFVVLNSTNGFTASIDIHRLRPGVECVRVLRRCPSLARAAAVVGGPGGGGVNAVGWVVVREPFEEGPRRAAVDAAQGERRRE